MALEPSPAPFFLIATPERLYSWKQDHPGIPDEPPRIHEDTATEFAHYLEKLNKTPQAIGEEALKLLVQRRQPIGNRVSSGSLGIEQIVC